MEEKKPVKVLIIGGRDQGLKAAIMAALTRMPKMEPIAFDEDLIGELSLLHNVSREKLEQAAKVLAEAGISAAEAAKAFANTAQGLGKTYQITSIKEEVDGYFQPPKTRAERRAKDRGGKLKMKNLGHKKKLFE